MHKSIPTCCSIKSHASFTRTSLFLRIPPPSSAHNHSIPVPSALFSRYVPTPFQLTRPYPISRFQVNTWPTSPRLRVEDETLRSGHRRIIFASCIPDPRRTTYSTAKHGFSVGCRPSARWVASNSNRGLVSLYSSEVLLKEAGQDGGLSLEPHFSMLLIFW